MVDETIDAGQSDGSGPVSGPVFGPAHINANDFNLVNATAADANNFQIALDYLQNSSLASNVLDLARGADVYFDHSNLYADEARTDGSGVVWNPDVALALADGNFMSPAVNLLSEFAHMVLPGGLGDNTTLDILRG